VKNIKPCNMPLRIREIPQSMRDYKYFKDLTGYRVGYLTVVGLSRDYREGWVARCTCGRFTIRHRSAIRPPANAHDRCEHCLRKRKVPPQNTKHFQENQP